MVKVYEQVDRVELWFISQEIVMCTTKFTKSHKLHNQWSNNVLSWVCPTFDLVANHKPILL